MYLAEQFTQFKDIIEADAVACRLFAERAPKDSTYSFSVVIATDSRTFMNSAMFSTLKKAVDWGKQIKSVNHSDCPRVKIKAWYPDKGELIGMEVAKFKQALSQSNLGSCG